MEWIQTITLVLGSGFTSGINLYLTVTVLGLFQKFSFIKLPGCLDIINNWWIIGIAIFLFGLEFCVDKIPYADTVWDLVHTFIRIPAAAGLAYYGSANFDSSTQTVMVLLGGGTALASHGTLTTGRAFVNLSPEPVSTWIVSIIEDVFVFISAIIVAFAPIIIGVLAGIFLILFVVMLPLSIMIVIKLFKKIRNFLRRRKQPVTVYGQHAQNQWM